MGQTLASLQFVWGNRPRAPNGADEPSVCKWMLHEASWEQGQDRWVSYHNKKDPQTPSVGTPGSIQPPLDSGKEGQKGLA